MVSRRLLLETRFWEPLPKTSLKNLTFYTLPSSYWKGGVF